MRPRGVVLVDVVMMLAVLGIVLLAVMPSAHPGESMRLVAASMVVASDLEYAQSATLARPDDPTVVRFDADGARYWLALASDPEAPILRPDGVESYEVEFGFGVHRELWGVVMELQGIGDRTLVFDAMGRLVSSEDGVVRMRNGTGDLAIVVRATTGSVSVVDGAQVPQSGVEVDESALPEAEGVVGAGAGPGGPFAPGGTGGTLTPPPQLDPGPSPSPPSKGLLGLGILGL